MLRQLTLHDIPAAFQLSCDAGWNQTLDDWRRLLTLDPDGCFCSEDNGRIVATTTLLCHDPHLAWLGMVLTHPDFRRRGFARSLVEAALAYAEVKEITTVKLDATDQGRPLYLALGFEDEQPIERWRREPGPLECLPIEFSLGPLDSALDRAAFGANRGRFLATLGAAYHFRDGFVLHRSGSRARYLGPCVARDASEAASALHVVVASSPMEPWFWDLLPRQTQAVRIARNLGFVPVRRLTRMRRGAPISADDRLVYAIADFAAG